MLQLERPPKPFHIAHNYHLSLVLGSFKIAYNYHLSHVLSSFSIAHLYHLYLILGSFSIVHLYHLSPFLGSFSIVHFCHLSPFLGSFSIVHFYHLSHVLGSFSITHFCLVLCRNPSLGLVTKARAYKGVGQEGSPGVWESVGECGNEHSHSQVSSHFGSWSPGGFPKSLASDCMGQNPLH